MWDDHHHIGTLLGRLFDHLFARGVFASGEVGSAAAMVLARIKRWNPFLKFGVPLISLTVLGSVALAHLQQGRKDVLTARDEKEWASMAANKALTREGAIAGAVADAVAKKKPLNLEEELNKVKIDDFEYVRVPKPKEVA
ncbi:hypothetical protein M758_9G073700 [Ceratodon purpureus]|nr:hypothetical protein M758_9G073700 [Ceratodon purpureus]